MIELSLANGIAEIVLNYPDKLNSLERGRACPAGQSVRRRCCRRLTR